MGERGFPGKKKWGLGYILFLYSFCSGSLVIWGHCWQSKSTTSFQQGKDQDNPASSALFGGRESHGVLRGDESQLSTDGLGSPYVV